MNIPAHQLRLTLASKGMFEIARPRPDGTVGYSPASAKEAKAAQRDGWTVCRYTDDGPIPVDPNEEQTR